jgi:phosphate transport system substrate-binding protein
MQQVNVRIKVREMDQKITVYVVTGLLIGVVAGFFASGPLTYNKQIASLKDRISELEGQEQLTLSGSLSIAGSTTVQPITQECATNFMQLYSKVQVSVSGGGSGHGVKAAGSGEVNIGEASRNIKASEWLSYPDLVAFAIGKDSVAVIVNSDDPLVGSFDLTLEEVSLIFSGEVSNWSELGGDDHEIEVYTREEGSGTREVFEDYVMKPFDAEFAGTASVKPSNGEMRASVAGNKYGVAYISLGYVDSTVRSVEIEGVEATIANVKAGDYPITRILWVFTKGFPSTLEKAFIDYVLSSEGQAVVEDLGYISVK